MNSASTVLGGASYNRAMVDILWHRRETRRITENTNLDLKLGRNSSTRHGVTLSLRPNMLVLG